MGLLSLQEIHVHSWSIFQAAMLVSRSVISKNRDGELGNVNPWFCGVNWENPFAGEISPHFYQYFMAIVNQPPPGPRTYPPEIAGLMIKAY